jgi:4-hydroxy-tetrahydrodipicolinate synthase
MKEAWFGRVITAIATPFDDEKRLDLDSLQKLAVYLVESGSDALVVTGSTGESGTLSDQERADAWRAVREAVSVPVIAGATTNDTEHSLRLVRDAEKVGAHGILAVTPYYNRPPQQGLFEHFRTICRSTELPVILYDIPARTGRKIALETSLKLIESCENVVAVKDASGDLTSAAALLAKAARPVTLYSGDDALTLPFISIGATGVISVASHWAGRAFQTMIQALLSGETAKAATINGYLLDSYRFESSDAFPNPIPTKAMLHWLGLVDPSCRLPLIDPPDSLIDEAGELYRKLESNLFREGITLRG